MQVALFPIFVGFNLPMYVYVTFVRQQLRSLASYEVKATYLDFTYWKILKKLASATQFVWRLFTQQLLR